MGSFLPSLTSAAKGSRWYTGRPLSPLSSVSSGRPSSSRIWPRSCLPALDDLGQEGVGAGGVVGRVGEGQDVLVLADGKALDGAELGVLQLLAQAFQVLGALGVAGGLLGGGLVGYELGLVGHTESLCLRIIALTDLLVAKIIGNLLSQSLIPSLLLITKPMTFTFTFWDASSPYLADQQRSRDSGLQC